MAERLSMISDEIASVRDEEQECFDNLPEQFQETERAATSENAIDELDDALDNLSAVIENLEEAAS